VREWTLMDTGQSNAPAEREPPAALFDRDFWDGRWSEVFREHADQVAQRPPNAYLTAMAGGLDPGRALDAGCGKGGEALWLAAHGWRVTAVDFSATALAHGQSTAATLGSDIAERIAWVEGDLAALVPDVGAYDLVTSLYVHVSGSVEEMVARLAIGVAPGGTMLLVGHLPIDPVTGAETPAAGQVQVTVEAAVAVLDAQRWELSIAEERPRAVARSGFDAVICARRLA
jgi:SAM-dependent methyltransferase